MKVPSALRITGELAAMFGALVALEHLVVGPERFTELQPHPFWLPVLTMAITYGSGIGLAAALIAAVLWLAAPHLGTWSNPFDRTFALALPPLLWIATGIAVGEVTRWRRRRLVREQQRVDELASAQTRLLAEHAKLVAINHDFQVAAVLHPGERQALVASVLAVEHGDERTSSRRLIGLVERLTGTSDVSVYIAEGATPRLFSADGTRNAPEFLPRHILEIATASQLPVACVTPDGPAADPLRLIMPLRPEPSASLVGVILFYSAPATGTGRAALIELAAVAEQIACLLASRSGKLPLRGDLAFGRGRS